MGSRADGGVQGPPGRREVSRQSMHARVIFSLCALRVFSKMVS
jgi:hypothetical protein